MEKKNYSIKSILSVAETYFKMASGGLNEAADPAAEATAATERAKSTPSAATHNAAATAHEKAVSHLEDKIDSIKSADHKGERDAEVMQHERQAKEHQQQAQRHRFHAFRLSQVQNESTELMEKLDPHADAGVWIKDFQASDDPRFAGKSAEDRKQQALAAWYAARREAGIKNEDTGEAGDPGERPEVELTPDKDNLAATDAADAQKKQEPQPEIPSWVPGNLPDDEKKEFAEAAKKAWESDNNTFDFKGRTYKITENTKNEELVGNQHKLDVDKDGKIDSKDLAALRAGKKEVEEDHMENEVETPGQTEYPGSGIEDTNGNGELDGEDKAKMQESLSAIVTRKNSNGSYDEVGMNNRRIVKGSHSSIMKQAAEYAKGPHRVELFHGDRVGYGDPHKVLHVESAQIKEGTAQTTHARVQSRYADEASKRASSYGGQNYHLHMIAHHHHANAAAQHERAADTSFDDDVKADHAGGASYHHDAADHHLKAANALKEGTISEASASELGKKASGLSSSAKTPADHEAAAKAHYKAAEAFRRRTTGTAGKNPGKSEDAAHSAALKHERKGDSHHAKSMKNEATEVKEGGPGTAEAGPMVTDPLTQQTKDDHDDETKVEEAPYTNKADGSENIVPADKPQAKPTPMNKVTGEQATKSVAEAYAAMHSNANGEPLSEAYLPYYNLLRSAKKGSDHLNKKYGPNFTKSSGDVYASHVFSHEANSLGKQADKSGLHHQHMMAHYGHLHAADQQDKANNSKAAAQHRAEAERHKNAAGKAPDLNESVVNEAKGAVDHSKAADAAFNDAVDIGDTANGHEGQMYDAHKNLGHDRKHELSWHPGGEHHVHMMAHHAFMHAAHLHKIAAAHATDPQQKKWHSNDVKSSLSLAKDHLDAAKSLKK